MADRDNASEPLNGLRQLVVFRVEAQRFALPVESVERVVGAVAVTPLPGAPATVSGIIDVAGATVPVFDLRRRVGLPARAAQADDRLVIARSPQRRLALQVDAAEGLAAATVETFSAPQVRGRDARHPYGVARLADGLVLIHDLDHFLSAAESQSLDAALQEASAGVR